MAGSRIVSSAARAKHFGVLASLSRSHEPLLGATFRHYSSLNCRENFLCTRRNVPIVSSYFASRNYCDDRQSPVPMPRLMEYPQLLWPSIFKVVKNWIMAKFVITPYFDQEFELKDFGEASRQAIEHVSKCLSNNDLNSLNGLVSSEALVEIRSSLSRYSAQQFSELAVNQKDIYFAFPYEVGVMFDDEDESQRRYVEITMVYFLMKGLADYQERTGQLPDFNEMRSPENQEKFFVLNYRFIREFTKGVSPDWTINMLNHYKGKPA